MKEPDIFWYPREQQVRPEFWGYYRVECKFSDRTGYLLEIPSTLLRGSYLLGINPEGWPFGYSWLETPFGYASVTPGYTPEFLHSCDCWAKTERLGVLTEEQAQELTDEIEGIYVHKTRNPVPNQQNPTPQMDDVNPFEWEPPVLAWQWTNWWRHHTPLHPLPAELGSWDHWLLQQLPCADLRHPPYQDIVHYGAKAAELEEPIGKAWRPQTKEELIEEATCWVGGRCIQDSISAWGGIQGQFVPPGAPVMPVEDAMSSLKGAELDFCWSCEGDPRTREEIVENGEPDPGPDYEPAEGFWVAGLYHLKKKGLMKFTVRHGHDVGAVITAAIRSWTDQ